MRVAHAKLMAAVWGAGLLAAAVRPSDEIDVTDKPRKTPPSKPAPPPQNLPGETNRQFAARMKATAASAVGTDERSEGVNP
jgi:hypothetical protein